MHSRSVEPTSVLPQAEWNAVLVDTLIEVFSTMARINVIVAAAPPDIPAQFTVMVGIAGAMRAKFTLECSDRFAVYLASQMLGIPPDDPDSLKAASDALGEICNIVSGYFKARVGLGDACKLSVPTIISGSNYSVRSRDTQQRMEVTVTNQEQLIRAVLEIAK